MQVRKRNGNIVDYDREFIVRAVTLVAGAAALSLCAKRVAISSPLVAIEGGRTEIKKAENGITARQLA